MRLLNVSDLQSFQRAIARTACHSDAWQVRNCAVIVPTRAAAQQLRQTLENLVLCEDLFEGRKVLTLPELVTRNDWYSHMHGRLSSAPARLTEFERDVYGRAATLDAVAAGAEPPFKLRPGLVVEALALYDDLRRQGLTIDTFERVIIRDLELGADLDRGARRLLTQTHFLVAAFRAYENRVLASQHLDEHGLRALLREVPAARPFRQVVVTVPDRVAESAGLWVADFELLQHLPGLEQVDVIATEGLLTAGFRERLHDLLPGIVEEQESDHTARFPILVVPDIGSSDLYFTSRDREEELVAIASSAKRLISVSREPDHEADFSDELQAEISDRAAIVFQGPLPYLYLARNVFDSLGVSFQTFDALPLAAEPYAAALDLVFTFVTSGYNRASIVELLKSPHFAFEQECRRVSSVEVAALDRQLRKSQYIGDRQLLARLVTEWADIGAVERANEDFRLAGHAGNVALRLAECLSSLEDEGPADELLDVLLDFLSKHQAPELLGDSLRERNLRAKAAIHGAIQGLRDAHAQHDRAQCKFGSLVAIIRRWIEGQTFTPRTGSVGMHFVDSRAARYGNFSQVRIVGLVDGEWPEHPRRNIFYPSSLMNMLGWPHESECLNAARAAFQDLIRLPTERLALSTFTLEEDSIVRPSTLLEDVADVGFSIEQEKVRSEAVVSVDETFSSEPTEPWVVEESAAAWLELRRTRSPAQEPVFHGSVGCQRPRTYGVRAVERYLDCPFKYFAASVLFIEDEPSDELTRERLRHGLFVHEAFRKFFKDWQDDGYGAISLDNLPQALEKFTAVVDELLTGLPVGVRALERNRLLGSPTAIGLADRLFRLEAEQPDDVMERLLEYSIEGEFEFKSHEGSRRVRLRGTVDRIDLRTNGTLRLVDYKIGRSPKPTRAIQLPLYSVCAEQHLDGRQGRKWKVNEAIYIAFGGPRFSVSIAHRDDLEAALSAGQERFLNAINGIERGDFPPRPAELSLCRSCHYSTVCRKDYVGES